MKPLIQVLRDECGDTENKRYAAEALGKIRDIRAINPLVQTLKYGNEDVRMSAASALGYIGDKKAIKPLVQVLKDASINEYAVSALGEIVDKLVVGLLNEAMKKQFGIKHFEDVPWNEVPKRAIDSLKMMENFFKDKNALEILISAFEEEEKELKRSEVEAFEKRSHKTMIQKWILGVERKEIELKIENNQFYLKTTDMEKPIQFEIIPSIAEKILDQLNSITTDPYIQKGLFEKVNGMDLIIDFTMSNDDYWKIKLKCNNNCFYADGLTPNDISRFKYILMDYLNS